MSEVIVRMEMPRIPQNCGECKFHKPLYHTQYCVLEGKNCSPWKTRKDWCPIVGVLPDEHGRLVDADGVALAMVEKGQMSSRYKWGEMWELNGLEIREALQTVPTIVPATERSET